MGNGDVDGGWWACGGVATLAYHKIGVPPDGHAPTWFYVPEATFVGHLDLLAELGCEVIDKATFVRGLSEPAALPARPALLTFDDAYRSMVTAVLPILVRRRLPAVLFAPAGLVGGTNAFDRGVEPEEPLCTWADLERLADRGVSVQSHGMSHARLSELGQAALRAELSESRRLLQARLGRVVDTLAYAYGDAGRDPADVYRLLEEEGYAAAFGYGATPGRTFANRYHLRRIAVGPDTDLRAVLGQSGGAPDHG